MVRKGSYYRSSWRKITTRHPPDSSHVNVHIAIAFAEATPIIVCHSVSHKEQGTYHCLWKSAYCRWRAANKFWARRYFKMKRLRSWEYCHMVGDSRKSHLWQLVIQRMNCIQSHLILGQAMPAHRGIVLLEMSIWPENLHWPMWHASLWWMNLPWMEKSQILVVPVPDEIVTRMLSLSVWALQSGNAGLASITCTLCHCLHTCELTEKN